jgi:predicted unusual protein kinase regulating ubiquinone biosynthesis (AarF/ABC1/UbiB family)
MAPPPLPGDSSTAQVAAGLEDSHIQWRRYRRTLRFAAWLFLRVALWELVLRRVVGEQVVGRSRTRRLRRWARESRALAVDMGGVMIKLGQFIASRIDLLPPAVIEELATLQDEVPTVAFDVMRQTLEQELGPLETNFAAFDPEPIAAASLGQAHRARLSSGERVVVKIQRPGIESLVFTDLKALEVVAGWLMHLRFIARRADVPALLDEFGGVLWEELDYHLEANNVAAFRQMFAEDFGIYIPQLYRQYSTRRVLTLEDVGTIKISDYAAIEAAGISRRDVARRLVNTYLWMVFVRRFFHADPHAGNLFVYPLAPDELPPTGQHRNGPPLLGRPFYLIFVDFGMVGRLTPEIADGLRETLIALATRDTHRLVQSYQRLGVLLPGTDLDRLEAATRAVFDRVWGLDMAAISRMPLAEVTDLGREFKDLLFSMPFQVPQDFLYLGRAVGILTGMATGLDPKYNPWKEIHPFIASLQAEEGEAMPFTSLFALTPRDLLRPETVRALLSDDSRELLLSTGWDLIRHALQLPIVADEVLRRADRGDLTLRIEPAPDLDQRLQALERAAQRTISAVIFAALAITSAILYAAGAHTLAGVGLGLALFTLLRVVLVR